MSNKWRKFMKVLVTGGAGYIGSHTVRELKRRGYDVVVLDTLERGHKQAVLETRLILGNIADGAFLKDILQTESPDAVMHFAAFKAPGESMQQPTAYFRNNVCGMLTLLDIMVCTDIRYCIFSSSCSIFGTP